MSFGAPPWTPEQTVVFDSSKQRWQLRNSKRLSELFETKLIPTLRYIDHEANHIRP